MSEPEPTRILLVDDHEVVRRGLRALLETHPGWVVCGEAADGRTAVSLARTLAPHVVVMDLTMPELNGLEATRQILDKAGQVQVLILSMHESEQFVREVLGAGARGYVLKSDAGRDLIAAVETLLQGKPFFTSRLAAKIHELEFKARGGRRSFKPAGQLTPREREVLQLLAEGKSNKEVGHLLGISVKTAETHRARVMRKLAVDSVADLVRYAIRNGFIAA
jgi:DNA-binding NarL/FixJ family response regulator